MSDPAIVDTDHDLLVRLDERLKVYLENQTRDSALYVADKREIWTAIDSLKESRAGNRAIVALLSALPSGAIGYLVAALMSAGG